METRLSGMELVHGAGDVIRARVERASDPAKIDHFWITLDAGIGAAVELSINTLSIKNRDAGFDPRVRVGGIRGEWSHLPPRGMAPVESFDYGKFESRHNIFYESMERKEIEVLLRSCATSCIRLEAWGAPYHRKGPGIHQIHSRRASCAVAADVEGRDGALRFYFEEGKVSRMLFFKFCGQL